MAQRARRADPDPGALGGSGRSRHQCGVRCDTAPRQGDGSSGSRHSGVDQSSGHWADTPTAFCTCCSAGLGMVPHDLLPHSLPNTTVCCVESKHDGFSGTETRGIRADVKLPWSGAG